MKIKLTSLNRKLTKAIIGIVLAVVIFVFGGLDKTAYAEVKPIPPIFACYSLTMECHFYETMEGIYDEITTSFQFTVVTALLNAMTYFTQQISLKAADWIIAGAKGQNMAYYAETWGDFLANTAQGTAAVFISEMSEYTDAQWGFNICEPITLDLQLSLGVGKFDFLPSKDCSFQTILENIETTAAGLDPRDLQDTLIKSLQPGGNKMGMVISANQKFINKIIETKEGDLMNRVEGGGFKPITDIIAGTIQTPAQVAKGYINETNVIKLTKEYQALNLNAMVSAAFVAGLKQLPLVAASTFVTTLASAGISALFDAMKGLRAEVGTVDLINPDAQGGTGRGPSPTIISDFMTPNLISNDRQDFTFELSSCTEPRGLWGCSMDDGLAAVLKAVNENGGFTIGRAAGIGAQVPGSPIFLHKDWELVPESEAKDNQDPGCYQRAYCASNLAKLRFARIITVGWELAANSAFNKKTNGRYVTLEQVVRGYNDCNTEGKLDAEHPWCHLIDPGWVLTAPQFRCRIKGYGETLMGSGFTQPIRLQECSDVITCIKRDDKGDCIGGYGYCLSEKTAWRFGADACHERYVSCRTYKSRDKSKILTDGNQNNSATGPEVSYIRNSIDYGSCNADNIGCMYYATVHDTSTMTAGKWLGSIEPDMAVTGERIYFDASVESCAASDDGCTKVFAREEGVSSLNLVKNSSFEETDEINPKKLLVWENYKQNNYLFNAFLATEGDSIYQDLQSAEFGTLSPPLVNEPSIFQKIRIEPLRNYTMSFYARKGNASGEGTAQLSVHLLKEDETEVNVPGTFYRSTNCNSIGVPEDNKPRPGVGAYPTADWQRYTCEFVSTPDAYYGKVVVRGENVAIDAVQIEEGDYATSYLSGINTELKAMHLKLPPVEFGCTGNKTTDRKECENYAQMCRQTFAGCQGYTEVGGGDGTEIPAMLTRQDYCPRQCVGYAEYLKLPSGFDLVKNPTEDYLHDKEDDTSAYFIPSSAAQCSAGSAGCEEFTNVESQAEGGEQKFYANYIRACLNPSKPENQGLTRTYFTWEGSDTTGYQLRTWSLIQKSSAGDDQYDVPAYAFAVLPKAPKILRKAGPDGLVKDPATCNEDSWKSGNDPDCRQIYDEDGQVYYRYFSQTIISATDCVDYRRDNTNLDDCTKTGGTFNQNTNECIYHINAGQSFQCSAANAGCRGYIGTTGRNTAIVYEEDFRNGTSTKFVELNEKTSAMLSNEALFVGDFSLKVAKKDTNSNGMIGAATEFETATNTLYTVSFWAKTTEVKPAPVTLTVNGITIGTINMQLDWKRYELGPFRVSGGKASSIMAWVNLPHTSFLDQVNITKLQDIVYVKKNSWIIPPICDQTIEGIPQEQAMVGCREFADRNAKVATVRQFSRLCRYDYIGCTGFVDTRNSSDPYEESFVMSGMDAGNLTKPWDKLYSGVITVTRPADRFIYAIDDPSMQCQETAAGCRAFGKPKFNKKQQLDAKEPFETIYLKDDITKYVDQGREPKMLCRPDELFCERYTGLPKTSAAITSYFRDPQDHVCEWKDKVVLSETQFYPKGEYSGWFIKGQEPVEPCYPESLAKANTFLFEYAGTPDYKGWTAVCPADQAECTEYRDVNDRTDQFHPLGRSYFFIDNPKLDKSTCTGKVDPWGGCVLFRDMNDSQLVYSTIASYGKSHAENDSPVAPINCLQDQDNPFCQNAGVCLDVSLDACDDKNLVTNECLVSKEEINKVIRETQGKTCNTDADCVYSPNYVMGFSVKGRCQKNDANLVLKVKLDRDCVTWLGCSTAETVYDASQAKYVDLCNDLSVCDQSLGATGKDFCSHYLDRSFKAPKPKYGQGFYEPVLREGQFFNLTKYADRPVGFGQTDYSGYAVPNHFQVADLVTRRVAYEILANRPGPLRNKFAQDYRLAAAVPMYSTGETLADVIFDQTYSDLDLCQHKQTGQIGYYVKSEYEPNENLKGYCYFAVDTPYAKNTTFVLLGSSGNNPHDVTKLIQYFEQLENPELKQTLSQAFPNPECKAYPDASSPYPNYYVKEWDETKDPPQPKEFVGGYSGVAYCEKGEDCACSYRKVSYAKGGLTKYFSMYGEAPPTGICVGGTRDGESCVPDASPSTSAVPPNDSDARGIEAGGTDANQMCGLAGICQPITTVSFVRGLFGQCLQRDASRIIAGSQEKNPCMIWNPSPVLFGKNDVYHYQPTAGYLPPQNSGEYYCVSSARQPKNVAIPGNTDEGWLDSPGDLTKFHYDDDYVSKGGDLPTDEGNEGTLLDGSKPEGGDMGDWCEDADDDQDDGTGNVSLPVGGVITSVPDITFSHRVDNMAGRWITTGRGSGRNHTEYFIPFTASSWTKAIYQGSSMNTDDPLVQQKAMMERNFAFFSFTPIRNPNGNGDLGCAMTPEWVDGVSISDYDDVDTVKEAQKVFDSGFRQNFKGILTRDTAGFLTNEDGTQLQKVKCMFPESSPDDSRCFYKYWELNYRSEGQKKFLMTEARPDNTLWDSNPSPYYSQSSANKAFFAIRAMFESINSADNAQDKEDTNATPPNGASLAGPFRFVGFWVTAAVPGTFTERALYMYLTVGYADICSQVAQVVSPDTREAAAFNDRVYEGGTFSLPLLGYTYSTVNQPFGAAMHTKAIGLDPLFQIVGKMPGTKSKLSPPTFIAAGQQYDLGTQKYPTGRWAILSNLFARIYRVYRYYDNPVSENSGICTDGPNIDGFCPKNAIGGDTKEARDFSKIYCGWGGVCTTYPVDKTADYGACNALSGVNAGLPCSSDVNSDLTGYHVCHNAPMRWDEENGLLTPQYVDCKINPNWSYDPNNDVYYQCPISGNWGDPGCEGVESKSDAINQGAFRCEEGAVELEIPWKGNSALKCSGESSGGSTDCPRMVIGDNQYTNQKADDDNFMHSGCDTSKHVCKNGFGHAACNSDTDCQFTNMEYWGKYKADRPWGGLTNPALQDVENEDIDWTAEIENSYGARPSQWVVYYYGKGEGVDTWQNAASNDEVSDWMWTYFWYGKDRNSDYPDNMVTAGATWWTTHNSLSGISFASTDIAGHDMTGGGFQRLDYPGPTGLQSFPAVNSISSLNRSPGAYAGAIVASRISTDAQEGKYALLIPGHCEKSLSENMDAVGSTFEQGSVQAIAATDDTDNQEEMSSVVRSIEHDEPYAEISWFCQDDYDLTWNSEKWVCSDDLGTACDCDKVAGTSKDEDEWQIYRRYFGPGTWEIGICEGGARAGDLCNTANENRDCMPEYVTPDMEEASEKYCKSPTDPALAAKCTPKNFPFPCDPDSFDLEKDCNLCTHNAGYFPRGDLCGKNPDKAQCLTGYKMLDIQKSADQDKAASLPPTDVSYGLYTPDYLRNKPGDAAKFSYSTYYSPRPPRIAAPDVARGCSSPGQCPITQWDAFTFENQSEGMVALVGGQSMNTIRFYGWAADNQGGLKEAWIDWGDGMVQEFHDVKMKNKKPFCGIGRECQFIPGLTCSSDIDCPPAGGRCQDVGYCQARPAQSCSRDEECPPKVLHDKCIKHVPFGSTEMACEQNYFEYTHVYSCGKEMKEILEPCGSQMYCSRENSRKCSQDSNCGVGDKCLVGLAPPGGCFDYDKSACRFTPRVMLKDNWGWCTGECRRKDLGNGLLGVGAIGTEDVIFKNGGCYDGTHLTSNMNSQQQIITTNYCDPKTENYSPANRWIRPWIVFKGALQLGIAP